MKNENEQEVTPVSPQPEAEAKQKKPEKNASKKDRKEAKEKDTAQEELPELITVEKAKLEAASAAFEEAKQKAELYLDQLRRSQADFENYRKRNASLRTETEDEAVRGAFKELLPTVDNLERALAAATEESPLKSGVEMTLRGMLEAMAKLGMESIACEQGAKFDPELHNAVMTMEADEEHPVDTITEVFQKGYMVRGKAIRYAMVKVAKEE